MKKKNRPIAPHVDIISLFLFSSLLFFVSHALAQADIGTVKNPDGSTTTTERDKTYGEYGRKVITKDKQGRVTSEELKGNVKNDRTRDALEKTTTTYTKIGGLTRKWTFNKDVYGGKPSIATYKETDTDLNGKIIVDTTTKFVDGKISEYASVFNDPKTGKTSFFESKYKVNSVTGEAEEVEHTVIEVDASGKKTTSKYNYKTKKYEIVEPEKKEEPKKEPEKKDDGTLKKTAPAGFAPGKYIGTVTIEHLDKCEEFGWGKPNDPLGRSSTGVYLTVEPQSSVLKIETDEGNTKAGDWFETAQNTLTMTSDRITGGSAEKKTLYTFDITFTYNTAAKEYMGTGTWGFHDNCEKNYPVTMTLKAR